MAANCTLSDQELIDKCDQWVTSLAKSGGETWSLSVPVNFNKDPDMLFIELINRFKALKHTAPITDIGPVSRGLPAH